MDDSVLIATLAGLRTSVEGLSGRVSRLQDDMAGLRGDIVGKLEGIEDRFTAFREDVFVAVVSASHAVDRTGKARDEVETLTKLVTSMQRTLQRVQTRLDGLERKAPGT